MSCRNSPAGSLATTYAARRYGLLDGQCTSLFHELRRHARAAGTRTYLGRYTTACNDMETAILSTAEWTPALRRRALERVATVRNAGLPSDNSEAWALAHMDRRSSEAAAAVRQYLTVVSRQRGIPVEQVRAEFWRLAADPDRDVSRRLPALTAPFPDDKGTRWALHCLEHCAHCARCGQFRPLQGPHTCPAPAPRPPHDPGRADSPAERSDDTGIDTGAVTAPDPVQALQSPPESPAGTETGWTHDMDAFQDTYDKVKARLDNGETLAPTFPHLENVPGALTGGLATPGTGNTFGIELEFDFPDEQWPYELRHAFANRLYTEGITLEPVTERWHHVGEEGADRPGGDFHISPNEWSCESDRSVDGLDGARGVEIKSQILYDEPRTWANLRRICDIATELGGRPTPRCGMHVNVGVDGYPPDDSANHTRLLRLASAYDDTLIRMAHNPASGPTHRGRQYCNPVSVPPEGFHNVDVARSWSNHYQAFNLNHVPSLSSPARTSSRIEARLFDSSLDPGRIQAQVALTLAIVAAARNGTDPAQGPEHAGAHRSEYGTRRLTGTRWEASTASFRQLVDIAAQQGLNQPEHHEMLTWLFASTKWQR